jgi:hypothetical protein
MATPNWDEERSKLRDRFTDGSIIAATRPELESYMVVLANSRNASGLVPQHMHEPETKAFSIVVAHLLKIRLNEELHKKSHRISVFALWVAIAAAVFSGFQWWRDSQNIHTTVSAPVPAISSSPSPTAKELTPESKMPLTNTSAALLTNMQRFHKQPPQIGELPALALSLYFRQKFIIFYAPLRSHH